MTEIVPPVLSSDHGVEYAFHGVASNLNDRSYFGPDFASSELRTKIRDYYSIDKLVEFLKRGKNEEEANTNAKYKAITLQFPDDLISDSAIIVQMIQEGLNNSDMEIDLTEHHRRPPPPHHHDHKDKSCGTKENKSDDIEAAYKPCSDKKNGACTCDKKKAKTDEEMDSGSIKQNVFILADTSYSPCCVDEVAAEHVAADIVVHFGDACLNPIRKLPAVYVFGKPFLSHDKLISQFKQTYSDKDAKICLMSDCPFSYHLPELYNALKSEYSNLIYADIYNSNDSVIIDHDQVSSNTLSDTCQASSTTVNRVLSGLPQQEDSGDDEDADFDSVTQEYELFHINLPPPPRLLELSTKFSTITAYETSSESISEGPFPSLMRRYRYMHIARTAGTIGILVNTLSLSNTKALMNKVIAKVKEAGKKHYVFVVGKPNVAKLANFESIDIWCVLGCGQSGIIIDNVGEYYKPIITPYELQMALSDELTWTGKWIVDFKEVLKLEEDTDVLKNGDEEEKNSEDHSDDDAPEFDVVTGKYVSTSRPLRRYVQHLEIGAADEDKTEQEEEGALVKRFSSAVAIKGTVSTSAVSLQNRHWTGLGSDFKQDNGSGDEGENDDGAVVEEGRGGIARGYDFDRANNNL